MDELQHFDAVVKYANGSIYQHDNKSSRLELRTAKSLVLYGSPEYLERVPKDALPPFREMVGPQFDPMVNKISSMAAESYANHEMHSPPLYYFVAGKWLELGDMLKMSEGLLPYWVRFLNVPLYGVMVWLAYLFCKSLFTTDRVLRIGVPLVLSAFPNDIFYSINNDVFSPLACLVAFYLLHQVHAHDKSPGYYILTGIGVSFTLLVKLTNMPVFLLCGAFVIILLYRKVASRQPLSAFVPHFTLLCLCSIAPLLLWMAWNYHELGDLTGASEKLRILGWTRKPFWEWFSHPMFTVAGLDNLIGNLRLLGATFWRGELVVWQGVNDSPFLADLLYTISSVLFVAAGIAGLWSSRQEGLSTPFVAKSAILLLLLLFLCFLAILSIQFDFGDCPTPSRENPYFNKGRLILGGLVPFVIFYVDGLRRLLSMINPKANPLYATGALSVLILLISTISSSRVFGSEWNWFRLLH